MLGSEGVQAAEVRVAGRRTHLDCETYDPVGEEPAGVHKEVHHVRVIRILYPGKSRFHHREARLHEHDQEAADQRPNEVGGDLVLADLVSHIRKCDANLGIGGRNIIDRSGDGSARIALLQIHHRGRFAGGILELGVGCGGRRWRRGCGWGWSLGVAG